MHDLEIKLLLTGYAYFKMSIFIILQKKHPLQFFLNVYKEKLDVKYM